MFLPRIIPVLLLKGKGLVKTVQFKDPRYLGDPINAVRIFNDLKADELVFLDITASTEKRTISNSLIKDIGDEAFMPFGVAGGFQSVQAIELALKSGAEKVILNTALHTSRMMVAEAVKNFGSQSIVASIDAKRSLFGKYQAVVQSAAVKTGVSPVEMAKTAEDLGCGEIIINSVDQDGMMKGYDLELIKSVAEAVHIPVVGCGGAGTITDLYNVVEIGGAHAAAAGSLFVYHGTRKAVLINYPSKKEVMEIFKS